MPVGQESMERLAWFSDLESLISLQMRWWQWPESPPGSTGKGCTSNLFQGFFAGFSAFKAIELRIQFLTGCWPMDALFFLPHGSLHRAAHNIGTDFIDVSKGVREKVCKQIRNHCLLWPNLRSDILSFCCFLLVRTKITRSSPQTRRMANTRERDYTRIWILEVRSHWKAAYCNCLVFGI